MNNPTQYLTPNPTVYVSLTGTEAYNAWRLGLCVVCASKMRGGDCLCRYCDSCSQYWIADTYDAGDGLPAKEDCPPCVEWWANLHLENQAYSPTYPDWMRTRAWEERYHQAAVAA